MLVIGVLLVNHVMLQGFHYALDAGHWLVRDLFDVDVEESFPTWFSSALLLSCAAALHVIASTAMGERKRFGWHWRLLSLGFLALSVDEVAGVHESLNTATEFSWTIPGAIVVACVGAAYINFLRNLPPKTCFGFLLAGSLFVGGAVMVEHATDWYLEHHEIDSLGYNLLTALEEGMEMLGALVFLNTLLAYLGTETPTQTGVDVTVE